jgi:hypothetical protein
MGGGEPQAKGVWFVTARRQIASAHGDGAVERVATRMGDDHAHALLDPMTSAWYPEATFQRAMAAVSEETCEGDPDRFVEFIEACTVQGINRFLRVILSFTSAPYLLGKMPVFWARHRLNNGKLDVELGERSARLSYSEFPFFDDRNYRLFVRGVLRKTVEVSSGQRPDVLVRDYARDRLVVDVHYAGAATSMRPPRD